MAPPITASLWVGSILWQCSLIKEPVWPLQRGYLSSALSSPLSLFAHRTLIDAFKGPGNVDSVASSMSPGKRERTRLFAGAHNPIPAAPVFSSPGRFVGHRFMFLNHCYQSRRACDREIEKRLIGSWREEGPTTKPTSELCNAPTKKLPYDHGGILSFNEFTRVLQLRDYSSSALSLAQSTLRVFAKGLWLWFTQLSGAWIHLETTSLLRSNGTFQYLTGLQTIPIRKAYADFCCGWRRSRTGQNLAGD